MTDGNYMEDGEHIVMYVTVESVHCTPETNLKFNVNYTSVNIFQLIN